ncbi:MAG: hypothetical protein Tsb0033_15360 [Winogradskyella sp.]
MTNRIFYVTNLPFAKRIFIKQIYNWLCSRFNRFTHKPKIEIDFNSDDFKPILNSLVNTTTKERKTIVNEIKSQMKHILNHFIECNWGSHYNAVFKNLIKPYLDNPKVLDGVLKSEVIKDKNVIVGNTGAKIFPELMIYLKRVDSPKIQTYLKQEINL